MHPSIYFFFNSLPIFYVCSFLFFKVLYCRSWKLSCTIDGSFSDGHHLLSNSETSVNIFLIPLFDLSVFILFASTPRYVRSVFRLVKLDADVVFYLCEGLWTWLGRNVVSAIFIFCFFDFFLLFDSFSFIFYFRVLEFWINWYRSSFSSSWSPNWY